MRLAQVEMCEQGIWALGLDLGIEIPRGWPHSLAEGVGLPSPPLTSLPRSACCQVVEGTPFTKHAPLPPPHYCPH